MITENDIERAIIAKLKEDTDLSKFTFANTLKALNPLTYDFASASGGAILVSCSGINYSVAPQFRNNAGATYSVVISLGISGIRDNTELWNKKNLVFSQIAYQKLLQQLGRMTPVADAPVTSEAVEGIFWVRLDFIVKNYTGI